jgi:nuclear protein localization family protein 4
MLLRIRSNVGVWRVDDLDDTTSTVADILARVAAARPHVVYEKPLSFDPPCNQPLDTSKTLSEQGLTHGAMIHCRVDASTCVDISAKQTAQDDEKPEASEQKQSSTNMRRVIDKDGSIKLVHSDAPVVAEDRGFRQGLLPLRDIKKHWTLNEFVAMDEQYVFKMKRQPEAFSNGVTLDSPSVADFQAYLRRFNFSRSRCGYLYGKFLEDNTAQVEAIYEPPQEADPEAAEGFVLLEDPLEEKVEQLAQLLGLRKVGWIFGHPPREQGFVMNAAEIIMAAELQLEAAGGIEETPFVTVKVTVGDDGNASVEAFQVSKQCMEMVAEEALEVGPNPGFCIVNPTFTAIQEGKESKTVENNFFLTLVPIVQHNSETFVTKFPKHNRDHDDRTPSHDELKKQLSKSGSAGWTFIELLSDFHLLLYLSQFLDMSADVPKICESVVNRDIPLKEGYKLIIGSMAGIDGSY